MKTFILIGAAGYIAPRHLKAIKETGNDLVAAFDVSDSVGILDSYFPDAEFFSEFEKLNEFIEDLSLNGNKIDYISICSPNYLHIPHAKFALKKGIDVICEKPLALNTADLVSLEQYESQYNARLFSILQLRLHKSILELKEKVSSGNASKIYDIDLTYITSRGKWYLNSWKGEESKSGGLATNIGVHFYDMLQFVFGALKDLVVYHRDEKTVSGFMSLDRANVRWFLSIDSSYLPSAEKRTYRSILIEGEELEFSEGFTDLHTQSYQQIVEGNGFGVSENYRAIKAVEDIRTLSIDTSFANCHPFIKNKK